MNPAWVAAIGTLVTIALALVAIGRSAATQRDLKDLRAEILKRIDKVEELAADAHKRITSMAEGLYEYREKIAERLGRAEMASELGATHMKETEERVVKIVDDTRADIRGIHARLNEFQQQRA